MNNIKKQQGMTVISWLVVAALFTFIAITVVKLVPVYIKYNSVQSIIDKVVAEPKAKKMKKQAIFAKVDSYINISSIYDLTSKQFVVEKIQNRKKSRKLSVSYEDRIHWFANLDIVAVFEYSAIIGEQENIE